VTEHTTAYCFGGRQYVHETDGELTHVATKRRRFSN